MTSSRSDATPGARDGAGTPVSGRSVGVGAVVVIAAAAVYLLAEAASAVVWRTPPYDYFTNAISDLGDPIPHDTVDGQNIDSPLHLVMDTGFILLGALTVLAAILLLPVVRRNRDRVLLVLPPILHLLGLVFIATNPLSSYNFAHGGQLMHGLGALLAIGGGNLWAVTSVAWARSFSLPRWFARVGLILGIIGLVTLAGELTLPLFANATAERLSVYTLIAFDVLLGIVLLRRRWTLAQYSVRARPPGV